MEKETVMIHNRSYETVASRFNRFVAEHEFYTLESKITPNGEGCYFETVITVFDKDGKVIRKASGHAYERKDSSTINKTSHVENAETSAVGRALAFLGYAGGDIASADEVATAILNQQQLEEISVKEVRELDDSQVGNFVMPFGKYKGLRLTQIVAQENGTGKSNGLEYLQWLSENSNRTDIKSVIEKFLGEFK